MIYTPYIGPLLIAAAILGGIAIYVRRFRDVPVAVPFSVLMWLCARYTLFTALSLSSVLLLPKILSSQLVFISTALLPPTILALALGYTGQADWLTRRQLGLLLILSTRHESRRQPERS